MSGFSVIFEVFLHPFVLAKLATSRVNCQKFIIEQSYAAVKVFMINHYKPKSDIHCTIKQKVTTDRFPSVPYSIQTEQPK